MHADAAVLTGTRHGAVAAPCQDYALAASLGPQHAIALVADGCSTGGHTDLGARAWVLAALAALQRRDGLVPAAVLQRMVLARAGRILQALAFEDAFATLGVLQAHGDEVRAAFWGDGALLARHRDGSLTLVNLQYGDNAPPYLNYRRNRRARAAWQAAHGGQTLRIDIVRCSPEGVVATECHEAPAGPEPWEWHAHAGRDALEVVVLATDGVCSRAEGFAATARQLLAIQASAGEFLRRRLGRQGRAWQAAASSPTDDLAAAGIWLGD